MDSKITTGIKDGEVYAIIPARSGSKGITDKNIYCLKGYPLLAYSIAACKLCKGVDRIIVSTNSSYYADIARYYGADAPFLRPNEISGDSSTDIEFMEHAIDWLWENERSVPELFLHVRPTYPLRDVDIMESALEMFKNDKSATSLRSAHKSSALPYKWFNLNKNGYFMPIWGDMTPDEANNPRQNFPDVYIPDGYVDVLSTKYIVENDLMHGDKVLGFVVPDGIDVDELKDMQKVEEILSQCSHPLYEYLKSNYKTLKEWEGK